MRRTSIRAVVVVVPVHDEEQLLERCLAAIGSAVEEIDVPCEVRVVLDACTDGSASIAYRFPVPVIEVTAHAVGVARALGISSGLASLNDVDDRRIWIANTDADSIVPANWLRVQLAHAKAGADLVVGTVRPEFADLRPQHRRHWLDTHVPGAPNGHTHGANLGIRAAVYREVGGFPPVSEHEDVTLVDRCRAIEAMIVASDAAEVHTSGRFVGRTPGGYAGYLQDQDRMLRRAEARELAGHE